MINISRENRNYTGREIKRAVISSSSGKKRENSCSNLAFEAANLNNVTKKPDLLEGAGLFLKRKIKGSLEFMERHCKDFLEGEGNPYIVDVVNFGSKILLSPLMILSIAPLTRDWDKDKDSIKASAILHPIQAALTLSFAFLTSIFANKAIHHYANKGTLLKSIDPEFAYKFNPNAAINPHGMENLNKLKGYSTIAFTLAMIPVAGKVLDILLPKILKDDKHIKSSDRVLDSIYARRLYVRFGQKEKIEEVTPNKTYA